MADGDGAVEAAGSDAAGNPTVPRVAPPAPPPSSGPQNPTFTQEQLDAIVGKAKADAQRSSTNSLLSELGFQKAEDLKAAVSAMRDAEKAQMTAVERALAEANEAKAAAEADRQSVAAERHSLIVERTLAAAGAQGDTAKLVRLVSSEIGADGSTITAAVDALKGEFPQLFGFRATPSPSEPAGGTPPVRPTNGQDPVARGKEIAEKYNAGQRTFLQNS